MFLKAWFENFWNLLVYNVSIYYQYIQLHWYCLSSLAVLASKFVRHANAEQKTEKLFYVYVTFTSLSTFKIASFTVLIQLIFHAFCVFFLHFLFIVIQSCLIYILFS